MTLIFFRSGSPIEIKESPDQVAAFVRDQRPGDVAIVTLDTDRKAWVCIDAIAWWTEAAR